MRVNRILRVKDLEEKEKARELFEIRREIERIELEISKIETEISSINAEIPYSSQPERLIHKQRALVSKVQELRQKLETLKKAEALSEDKLKDAKRETKALEIYKDKLLYTEYQRAIKKEFIEQNFIYMIKKFLAVLLLVFIPAFSQSALQKKMMEEENKEKESRLEVMLKDIDERLKRLVEERKKLEALRAKPLTEEQQEKVKKLIKVISKTPSDEAGAILNNLEPEVAAEILLSLKERQAGQILAAMNPDKAAEVAKIVMKRKKDGKKE